MAGDLKTFINPETGETVRIVEVEPPRIFNESPEFLQVLNSQAFQRIYSQTFSDLAEGEKALVINRPGAVVFAKENEEDVVKRLIILRPHGFTADAPDELSAHPEARWAKIHVYGGLRSYSRNPMLLKKVVRFCYYDQVDAKTCANTPYAHKNPADPHYYEVEKSTRASFYAVKENGFGFFHNIVNQTKEWVLLGLEKQLLDRKEPEFEPMLLALNAAERRKAETLLRLMAQFGDETFKVAPTLVDEVVAFEPSRSLPFLIEALNLRENGRHNPCTAFGVILKIARRNPDVALAYLEDALEKRTAPKYYLQDLLQKVRRITPKA